MIYKDETFTIFVLCFNIGKNREKERETERHKQNEIFPRK